MPKRTHTLKILVALAVAIGCGTSPRVILACESSKPFQVPLEGYGPAPFFETLGSLEFFKVRNIEGSLEFRVLKYADGKFANEDTPLRKASLILRNAQTGDTVESFTTDGQGYFKFTDRSPGSYVLQIVQSDERAKFVKLQGNLLIDLRADAKELHLPRLALSMSDCGMAVDKKNDDDPVNQQPESTHAQTN